MYEENIEKILKQDIRDKKKTGYGIHKRASRKKGFKGGIKLGEVDYLYGKAREKYIREKSGKVVVYSMYDVVMSRKDFDSLSREEKTKTIQAYLQKHGVQTIMEMWDVSRASVSGIAYRLGVTIDGILKKGTNIDSKETAKRLTDKNSKSTTTNKTMPIEVKTQIVNTENTSVKNEKHNNNMLEKILTAMVEETRKVNSAIAKIEEKQRISENLENDGMTLKLPNKKYDGKELQDRLLAFAGLLSNKYIYNVKLEIVELEEIPVVEDKKEE